jgi:type III pantothenate kinase
MASPKSDQIWFGLMIGNSRLHWAKFKRDLLLEYWDTDYINPLQHRFDQDIPILLASVVPKQTMLWQQLNNVKVLALADLPLNNLYPTLGIDRGLAILGVGTQLGWPALVIDAGTALTFTGVDGEQNLVGGAILPGLKLQFSTLSQQTAALPTVEMPVKLPPRWGLGTPEAIKSGILYTLLAGIRDFIEAWLQEFPNSSIAITGGDRHVLLTYLEIEFPEIAMKIQGAAEAIFWGMSILNNEISSSIN